MPANIDDHPLNRISSDLPRRGGPNIQVTLALIVALVGVVLLVAGYLGVSGTTVTSDQLSYLASSTLPGIAVLVAGAVLLARAAAFESLVAWLSDASNDAESPTDPGE